MATNFVDESKAILRMCDLTSEPKRMLPPIRGYENQPLVSLEQAVEPLHSLVPDVDQMIWTVKQNCQHPPNDLSSDESASIMLFTLEWIPRESSFYFILNQALRSQNRNDLLPWFRFLHLFMFALSKLPTTTHRILYRGIKMDLSEEFLEGETVVWWAFTSCSSSIKVLEQFLGQTGHQTIFNIECDAPKDISQHSFYHSENEMLMYPARQFQVVSSFTSGKQLKIIHLKEIQPPFPLIHIPTIPSAKPEQINRIERPLSPTSILKPPSTNTDENKQLQKLIDDCEAHSKVNLEKQNVTDEDMEIVVQEAIINKQCKELRLEENKITSASVSIIAKALNNNTTLKVLYLGNNTLCDTGIQPLTKYTLTQ